MKIEDILSPIPERYSPADRELLLRAYRIAKEAHEGQTRKSGEPYINHPVAVANILLELMVPPAVVAAGILHDTVEDTEITIEDLQKTFGDEVALLVDGVTKLAQLPRVSHSGSRIRSSKADLATETLRKTFLAMGEDVRVVLIKLADRLHNMRTLGYMPEEKRIRIAKQTIDIFAPLASRLGIWQIKWELEDLAFRYTEPDTYKEIAQLLADRRSEREFQIEQIVERLNGIMQKNEFNAEVTGRPKHIYSIYRKMKRKGVGFEAIRDVRAVRILVPDLPTCYSVLGVIHSNWRPLPGEFDDYIAAPKDNFYQSLHTAVVYDDGKTLEVQIRTSDMHNQAEYGIAAHWRYKDNSPRDQDYERRVVWLRQLMDWMQDMEDANEFLDSMKTDVFSDRVYAFTPNGDIIDLPANSTSIDFAYHVHTEVGHRCRGAKVNGKLMPLDYVLKTGDQVEVLTAKRGGPSRDWLNPNLKLLTTNRAKSKVRQWFKIQDREQNITLGKSLFDRELRRLSIDNAKPSELATDFGYTGVDDLFMAIGIGDFSLGKVMNHLTQTEDSEADWLARFDDDVDKEIRFGDSGVSVLGLKGLLTTIARCCKPAPGDQIVGYITRGRGATIHRTDCPNVLRIKDRERLAQVSWGEEKATYPVSVQVKAYDRDGLVRDVSTVISNEGISMRQVKVDVDKNNKAVFNMTLEVENIDELVRILTILETLPNVFEARRLKPG